MTISAEAEECINSAILIIDEALSHMLNATLVSASEISDLLLDVRQKLTNN